MNRLRALSKENGQSPWLDNLQRSYLTSGELARMRDRGVRGLTSNPSIFEKAISGSADYDEQFQELAADEHPVIDDYWAMVLADIHGACDVFSRVYDETDGVDGYVSVEVDPGLAHDGPGTAARDLHERLHRRNLMVKIPATQEGLDPIRQMISEGRVHTTVDSLIATSHLRRQGVKEMPVTGRVRRCRVRLPVARSGRTGPCWADSRRA